MEREPLDSLRSRSHVSRAPGGLTQWLLAGLYDRTSTVYCVSSGGSGRLKAGGTATAASRAGSGAVGCGGHALRVPDCRAAATTGPAAVMQTGHLRISPERDAGGTPGARSCFVAGVLSQRRLPARQPAQACRRPRCGLAFACSAGERHRRCGAGSTELAVRRWQYHQRPLGARALGALTSF